jgi:hypothetical protein
MNWFPISRRSSGRLTAAVAAVAVAWFLFCTAGVALAEKNYSANEDSQSAGEPTPLPEKPNVLILPLRHAQAGEVAEVLRQVYGGMDLRVAVDERLNRLIVLTDPKMSKPVNYLVDVLDQQAGSTDGDKQAERNLQVRVLWLVYGPTAIGDEPDERSLSPAAIEALHDLGLAHPRIACQDVTTLSPPGDDFSTFQFKVPVNFDKLRVTFGGEGTVYGSGGGQYCIQLSIKTTDPGGENCQMSGSLVTPLEHYVVLGSTNFITDWQAEGSGYRSGYRSAFVVYLQEAPLAGR